MQRRTLAGWLLPTLAALTTPPACTVRAPAPNLLPLAGSVSLAVRGQAPPAGQVTVDATVAPPAGQVTVDAEVAPPAGQVTVGATVAPPAGQVTVDAEVEVVVPAGPPVLVEVVGAPVVEFFGVPLDGVREVVFVLDVSGSMTEPAGGVAATTVTGGGEPAAAPPPKVEAARAELVDALQRLPVGTRVNVILFAAGVEALSVAPFVLDEPAREAALLYARSAAADGPTALAPAMRLALLTATERVVLLSDGLGNVGGSSEDVLRDAREAMRGGVRIDAIGFGAGHDARLLQALASESGGLYQPL